MLKNSIDIGIVNYNGGDCLAECIGTLYAMTDVDVNVYVFDNNSTDTSVRLAEAEYPQCKFIKNRENIGYAGGCNYLIKQFTSDIVAVCNMDLEFDKGWALAIVNCFNENPQVDSVASLVVQKESGEVYATDINFFWDLHPICVSEDVDKTATKRVFGAYGAVMSFRKSLFDRIGFMDEDYFLFFEETEFFLRMNVHDRQVALCPDAVVYHHRSVSTVRYSTAKLYYTERNRMWTAIKYLPVWYLPFIIPLSIVRLFIMMKNGVPDTDSKGRKNSKADIILTLLRAWFLSLSKIGREWRKRRNIWKHSNHGPLFTLGIIQKYRLDFKQLRVR